MDLTYCTIDDTLGNSFVADGLSATPEQLARYNGSVIAGHPGLIVHDRERRLVKNASIIDVRGVKVWWGDLSPDVYAGMKGSWYVLSEYASFHEVDPHAVTTWVPTPEDPFLPPGAIRDFVPPLEATKFLLPYVKHAAFARIDDGKLVTNLSILSRTP